MALPATVAGTDRNVGIISFTLVCVL